MHTGDDVSGFLFTVEKDDDGIDQVTYLASYNKVELALFGEAGRQVLLWSLPIASVTGLAQESVLKWIIPKFKIISTNKEQTADGARSWLRIVGEALQRKLYVTFLDEGSNPPRAVDIPNFTVLQSVDVWGDNPSYQEKLLLISEEPLKQRPNFCL